MANRKKDRASLAAAPARTGPLKVTVNDEVLRRLYAAILRTARHRRGANGHKRSFHTAHLAATIELVAGDAIAPARREALIERMTGESAIHVIPPESSASSQLSVAAGVALSYQLEKRQSIVVALTSAAALELGGSHEALQYASIHKLPLVVVVDNSSDGLTSSPPADPTLKAQAHGIPGILVDANDALAVYRVAREAIHRARAGRGPSLIECRALQEAQDPLPHLEHYLEKLRLWTPEWKRELLGT